ncbi:MAG: tetratricopeptide repeat protein [Nitrospira defluvii]|nr:tetratricopeptide repeat protein [Nitrospira defluvii]
MKETCQHRDCVYFFAFIFILVALFSGPHSAVAKTAVPQADADVLVAQAVLAYEEELYEVAQDLLNRALELSPHDVRGLYYMGLTQLALKQPDKAVEPLERADQLSPGDANIQYQLGVAYFSAGKFDQAAPLFEDLYKTDPERENLGYYVGFNRYRQKKYKEAAEALDKAKIKDSSLVQLSHFYRGLALGVMGMSEEAAAEIRTAQQTQMVSPITGTGLLRLGDVIATGQPVTPQKRLRAQISLGGYYDDNVAINPNPSRDPFAETLRSRKTTSGGGIANAFFDYSFLQKGSFEATATYGFLQTYNANNDLDRFNFQNHQVGVNGFYRGTVFDMPFQWGLHYTYDYLFLNMTGFLSRHSPSTTLSIAEPTIDLPLLGKMANLTTLIGRYQVKSFFGEFGDFDSRFISQFRDGYNAMGGLLHVFRFAEDRFLIRVGYQHDNESTSGTDFSYVGNRLQVGGQVGLGWGVTVRYDYDIHWRDYKNGQSLFVDDNLNNGTKRRDIEQTHFVQISKQLSDHFSVSAQYQRIREDSNIPVYDYTKNVYTALVTWVY